MMVPSVILLNLQSVLSAKLAMAHRDSSNLTTIPNMHLLTQTTTRSKLDHFIIQTLETIKHTHTNQQQQQPS